METVVTVNLGGVAYQLETSAHQALSAYLEAARATLTNNPDKDEIVRDLEHAIADKARAYLSGHKNVVSGAEMQMILGEMGPVSPEGEEAAPQSEAPRMGAAPRRRLYRIKDGAWISGVSTGLAAYLDIDANIVRLLWILTAIFTGGATLIVYIVLMFVIPSAHTREEWAQAHGLAFNAQEVIERAKRQYSEFEAQGGWRGEWRNIRNSFSRDEGWTGYSTPPPPAAPSKPVGYVTRIFAGLLALITGIVGAALTIAFIVTIISLATQGDILGWDVPIDAPNWMLIVIACLIFAAISAPISGMRHASYDALSGRQGQTRGRGIEGFGTIVLIALVAWLIWLFVPASHGWFGAFPASLESFWDTITMNF